MGSDDVAAILREWGDEAEEGLERAVMEECGTFERLISLVAAVEAVLKLADEACELEVDGARMDWWDTSPTRLREAITAALTGAQPGEDEKHG
jgi:hypothetical protein